MRTISYIFISILLISCKSKISSYKADTSVNYIPYYLTVDKAKTFYGKNDHLRSFILLDSLFNKFRPINTIFYDELEMYCQLAVEFNKFEKLDTVTSIMVVDYGFNLSTWNDEPWIRIKKKLRWSDIDLQNKYATYKSKLNIELRDSIIEIFKKDQAIRKMTTDFSKIDSLDRNHEPYHIHFIKKYGYPSFKLVGGNGKDDPWNPAYMAVMLKHISLKGVIELEPILLNEIKRGNLYPDFYAGMLDIHKVVLKEKTDFEYFGTFRDVFPTDTLLTNNARESIGLPRKKFILKK